MGTTSMRTITPGWEISVFITPGERTHMIISRAWGRHTPDGLAPQGAVGSTWGIIEADATRIQARLHAQR